MFQMMGNSALGRVAQSACRRSMHLAHAVDSMLSPVRAV